MSVEIPSFLGSTNGHSFVKSSLNARRTALRLHPCPQLSVWAGAVFPSTGNGGLKGPPPRAQLSLPRWKVTRNTVDVVGTVDWVLSGVGRPKCYYDTLDDILPGNGVYIDLNGSTPAPYDGEITTKAEFLLHAGTEYKLSYRLAGNNRSNAGSPDEVRVSLTPGVFSVDISIADYLQPFTLYENPGITVGSDTMVRIVVGSLKSVGTGFTPLEGALLKEVKLENTTDSIVVFNDKF